MSKLKIEKSLPRKTRKTDDARAVAAASSGKLNTDQVRILRVLAKSKHPLSRKDLKIGVGINGLYSQSWLKSLQDLAARKLIAINISPDPEKSRGFTHEIRKLGANFLASTEKSAKEASAQAA